MALPANINYGTVSGVFLRAKADGVDVDRNPDGDPIRGLKVTFTPSISPALVKNTTATPPVTILIDPVVCTTDDDGVLCGPDGSPDVLLVASGDTDLDPSGWTWTVEIKSSPSFPRVAFAFVVGVDSGIDLSTVLPVPEGLGADLILWQQAVADTLAAKVAAQTAATDAQAAQAAAEAVPTTTAGLMEAVRADPTSAFTIGQNATFVGRRVRLVLALGQSNMSGRGTAYSAFTDPAHPRIFQYGSGATAITAAAEPLLMHDTPTGIGPAFQFARQYIKTLGPDDIVVIVPAAHSGTALSTATTPLGWRWGVAGNLAEQATAQALAAKAAAAVMWPGATVTVAAALWLQGEGDTDAALYVTDLDALIAGFRSALSVPTLPFILGQMVPEGLTGARATINQAHSETPYRVANTGFALGLSYAQNGDDTHYNARGARTMGARMFAEFQRVNAGIAAGTPVAVAWHTSFDAADLTLADLAAVGSWADSSGNGRTATQATPANQPVFRAGTAKAPAHVTFDGTDWLATAPFGAIQAQPVTIMAVVRASSAIVTAGGSRPFFHGLDATDMVIMQQRESSGNQRWQAYAGTTVSYGLDTADVARWAVITLVLNGAASVMRVNGVAATINPGVKGFAGITLGMDYAHTVGFIGDIATLKVRTGILPTAYIEAEEAALAARL